MHSSTMRTPRQRPPLDRDPRWKETPWTETPRQRPPDRDPLDREPTGQRTPWMDIPLDRDRDQPLWVDSNIYMIFIFYVNLHLFQSYEDRNVAFMYCVHVFRILYLSCNRKPMSILFP